MLKMWLLRHDAVHHMLAACLALHILQRRMLLSPLGCDPEFTALLGITYKHNLSECIQVSFNTSNQA